MSVDRRIFLAAGLASAVISVPRLSLATLNF